ncbi:hypothetical protein [Paenibacillus donghaensis]|uniref:Uncharacterized protein n=1 Tax=Paenibacillus donghaensis TaxID=414771 RepID=A0A2Z2KNE5_9BACL|nr:hypothetical protein [Paenibacillus donghaensis]ASA22712.1 hypothetical protein B9T62_19085 [Paenibacillus donghaensis]
MKTYITIGYFSNGADIVYAGKDRDKAMKIEPHQNFDSFNVDVWVDGEKTETYFRGLDEDLGWEHFSLKD